MIIFLTYKGNTKDWFVTAHDCRSDTSFHNIIFAMKMSYITLIANHSQMRDSKLFA